MRSVTAGYPSGGVRSVYPTPLMVWISGGPELVDLLAQVADVGLDDVGVAVEVVLPHVVEDLRLRERPAGVEHQVAQELVLGRA